MRMVTGLCALGCGLLMVSRAEAKVHINIDLSSQIMHVTSDSGSYDWRVSTARSGFRTPRGRYHPTGFQLMHYSHKYHMSPMPHTIFFDGGYAIHGTYSTSQLGRPASHGCVRLAPRDAALLYTMVKSEGAVITISGSPPRAVHYAKLHRRTSPFIYAHMRRRWGDEYDPFGYRRDEGRAPLAYAPAPNSRSSPRAWQGPAPSWEQ